MWAKVVPQGERGFQRLLGWGGRGPGRAFYLSTFNGKWGVWGVGPGADMTTSVDIDSSEWLHHVVVHEKGTTYRYINGTLVAQAEKKRWTVDSRVTIGGVDNDMVVDDVMIWDRALSKDEVKKLYKATGGK